MQLTADNETAIAAHPGIKVTWENGKAEAYCWECDRVVIQGGVTFAKRCTATDYDPEQAILDAE